MSSVIKSFKTLFSKRNKPDIREAESYADFVDRMDYYMVTNRKFEIPDEHVEPREAFWLVLYGLTHAEKVDMDDTKNLGFSPLLGAHVKPEDLYVYFNFGDDCDNNFRYMLLTVKHLLETNFTDPNGGFVTESQTSSNAVSDILKTILLRTEITERVKTMIVAIAEEIIPNKKFLVETVIDGMPFGKVFFDIMAAYLLDEDEPNFAYIDDKICEKFVGEYGKASMKNFQKIINNSERDNPMFVTCMLVLNKRNRFLDTYMFTMRDMSFLQSMLSWLCIDKHRRRLFMAMNMSGGSFDDVGIPLIRRIIGVAMMKNIAEFKDIMHFLNDVVYFHDGLGAETRAKIYCTVVIMIHKNDRKQGTMTDNSPYGSNTIEECFNMLFGVMNDDFLINVRDYLASDKVYELYDEFIYRLLKEPYETRMKHVKGHILLLMREQTVRKIEEDPDINMDPCDLNSVPNIISRTLTVVPDRSGKKLNMVIGTGETMKSIVASTNAPLAIAHEEDMEDIFGSLQKCRSIIGNDIPFLITEEELNV